MDSFWTVLTFRLAYTMITLMKRYVIMKYFSQLLIGLFISLSLGCTAVANGQNLTATAEGTAVSSEPASATPPPLLTFTYTPLPVPTSTVSPTTTSTSTRANTATATSTSTLTMQSSATPVPTQTSTPTTPPPTATSADTSAQVEHGLEVYKQQYCGLCHQLDAAATAGQFGPSHNDLGLTAEQRIHDAHYTGAATTAAEYIHESIITPKAYLVPGYEHTAHHMPAYGHLSENDVDALVQLLLQQR